MFVHPSKISSYSRLIKIGIPKCTFECCVLETKIYNLYLHIDISFHPRIHPLSFVFWLRAKTVKNYPVFSSSAQLLVWPPPASISEDQFLYSAVNFA